MNRFNLSSKSSEYIGLIVLLIVIGVVGRLVPHWPNVTPLGALAVWGGMRLGASRGLLVVLGTMLVTDLFLGFGNHQPLVIYGALVAGVLIASLIQKATLLSVAGVTLVNAGIFFLITNNNFLYSFSLYPKTWSGLLASYEAALPFLRASLTGDIIYVGVFFGLELLALRLFAIRQKPAIHTS